MNWSNFALMTLFNTAVCILLPRIVTLDWSNLARKAIVKIKSREAIEAQKTI